MPRRRRERLRSCRSLRVESPTHDPTFNVGPRNTPLGPDETHSVTAHGANGECTGIPTGATGLVLNVTAVDASAATFLTLWGDGDRPNASHLNPTPGEPPAPNAVTTDLTDTGGEFHVFNRFGNVHVIADVVGYYTDHSHEDLLARLDALETQVSTLDTGLAAKQDACAPGAVFGYAQVQGVGLDAALTDVNGFNCTGGTVQARREDTGDFVVRLEGIEATSTATGMVVHVTAVGVSGGRITGYGGFVGIGDIRVRLYDHAGTAVDSTFSITVIDPGFEPTP